MSFPPKYLTFKLTMINRDDIIELKSAQQLHKELKVNNLTFYPYPTIFLVLGFIQYMIALAKPL